LNLLSFPLITWNKRCLRWFWTRSSLRHWIRVLDVLSSLMTIKLMLYTPQL
jgi:hypothetical protein